MITLGKNLLADDVNALIERHFRRVRAQADHEVAESEIIADIRGLILSDLDEKVFVPKIRSAFLDLAEDFDNLLKKHVALKGAPQNESKERRELRIFSVLRDRDEFRRAALLFVENRTIDYPSRCRTEPAVISNNKSPNP